MNTLTLPSSFTDELKLPYRKNFRKGLIYAIIFHLLVILVYGSANYYDRFLKDNDSKNVQQRVINVSLADLEPPPSLNDEEPPPKPEEILTPPPKDIAALTPEPVA